MEPPIGSPHRRRSSCHPRIFCFLAAFLVLIAVAACGLAAVPTQEPTAAPLPTAVSLPPLTPQATAIALPTLVPQPTVISLPTLTPQPTAIGLPAVTPLPTVVGLPTITPDAPREPGLVEEMAPVDGVAIEVTVSDPRQADLILVTGLPNACYSFGTYDLSRDEDTIRVRVTNVRPDDPSLMCAEIYGMVTSRIPLGPDIEPCATYRVIANGKSFSVQAIGPEVRCGDAAAGSGVQVEVEIGETVPISSDGLALTFLEVSEDSRCPSDVVCVWAGRATISINLQRDGSSRGDFRLTLGDGAAAPVVQREGYRIRLTALDPYPISTRPTSSDQYLAILTVSKS